MKNSRIASFFEEQNDPNVWWKNIKLLYCKKKLQSCNQFCAYGKEEAQENIRGLQNQKQ